MKTPMKGTVPVGKRVRRNKLEEKISVALRGKVETSPIAAAKLYH